MPKSNDKQHLTDMKQTKERKTQSNPEVYSDGSIVENECSHQREIGCGSAPIKTLFDGNQIWRDKLVV